jgi:uncharacterized Zn-binding protein involved in type VI secretion
MSKRLILVGDPTTHGGKVISGSSISSVGDKPIARLGDLVDCPAHGVNKIIEGAPSYAIDGLPVALEGNRTECGSALIGTCSSSVG